MALSTSSAGMLNLRPRSEMSDARRRSALMEPDVWAGWYCVVSVVGVVMFEPFGN